MQPAAEEAVARASAPAPLAPPSSPWSPSAIEARRALRSRSAAAAVAAPGGKKGGNNNANDGGVGADHRVRAAKESSRLFWSLWHEGWYSEFAAHRQRLEQLARLDRDREKVSKREGEKERDGEGERERWISLSRRAR